MSQPTDAVNEQLNYYKQTAERYDGMHGRDEHATALSHIVTLMRGLGARSALDTGCGTGFAMRHLRASLPEVTVHGNDPSADLLRVAHERYGIDWTALDCVSSERLPYPDGAFDVVLETGVLHHVPRPAVVVGEMLRVARMAVFISDENCYGMGAFPMRLAKLVLSRAGWLGFANRLRRGGHEWYSTPGDGIGWTYSIFDSYPLVREACSSAIVIPTRSEPRAERCPLLYASHCLVVGLKATEDEQRES